jgi:hypothetical protein
MNITKTYNLLMKMGSELADRDFQWSNELKCDFNEVTRELKHQIGLLNYIPTEQEIRKSVKYVSGKEIELQKMEFNNIKYINN